MAIPPQPTPFASFDITLNDSPYNGIIRANQIARSPPTDYLVRTHRHCVVRPSSPYGQGGDAVRWLPMCRGIASKYRSHIMTAAVVTFFIDAIPMTRVSL
eukprot:2180334-Pyramimonas_sp.AAC.1